ncbi:MAG: hypothetical protein ACJ788_12480, partial [Ktedonobacteraceae bacterium]
KHIHNTNQNIYDNNLETTRLHVERNFSARVMAEKYTQIYEEVIAMNKEGARYLEEITSVRSV